MLPISAAPTKPTAAKVPPTAALLFKNPVLPPAVEPPTVVLVVEVGIMPSEVDVKYWYEVEKAVGWTSGVADEVLGTDVVKDEEDEELEEVEVEREVVVVVSDVALVGLVAKGEKLVVLLVLDVEGDDDDDDDDVDDEVVVELEAIEMAGLSCLARPAAFARRKE